MVETGEHDEEFGLEITEWTGDWQIINVGDCAECQHQQEALLADFDSMNLGSRSYRGRTHRLPYSLTLVVGHRESHPYALCPEPLAALADDEESFAAERTRFALVVGEPNDRNKQVETGERIDTVEAIRATTDGIVAEITAPHGDGECPHCGLALSEDCLLICPRCGAPY